MPHARQLLKDAVLIAVSLPPLCELIWILRLGAKFSKENAAAAIRALLETKNVMMNRPAVEAGLAILEAGGDFADGIMAHKGKWLGIVILHSFVKKTQKPPPAERRVAEARMKEIKYEH